MPREETIGSLEAIVRRELGRNTTGLGREARGGLLDAARSIAACRDPAPAILTGAFMPWADPPAAETDGPVGAAELAVGLREAGVPVRIATDSRCADVVRTALAAAGPSRDIPVDVVPAIDAEEAIAALAARYRDEHGITHAIAIERLGPARDGRVYDMTGRDLSDVTAPLQDLFDAGDWVRIGIGDGGNELGMGSLSRESVAAAVPQGERIHCVVPCDHLIVSTTSNWGAQALLTAVAVLWKDRTEAMLANLSGSRDLDILDQVVANGPAVDGVTQTKTRSVDGIGAGDLERTTNDLLASVGKPEDG